ncbi:MAG: oligosaccharide flippase family protein [Novosphingobium sp.]
MLKRLGMDVIIYGSAELLFRGAQFLVLPLYASVLSVSDFGIMALLTTSASLLGMVLNLGINSSVQRFYFEGGRTASNRAVLVTTGLVQLLVSGVIVLGAALLLAMTNSQVLEQQYGVGQGLAMIALAAILPDQITQYSQDVIRLQFSPLKFFIIALVRGLVGVLIGLYLLATLKMGIAGIMLGTLAGVLLSAPLSLLMIKGDITPSYDREWAGKLFRFGYPYVFAGAAYWIFGSIDRWLLARQGSMDQVGLLSIGMKFAYVVSFATFAFGRAWSPFAFRMHAEDPDYRRNYARILSAWFLLLALLGFALGLFSQELLHALTPREYWAAAPILAISAAAVVLDGTTLITVFGIVLEKRTNLMSYAAWIAAGANLGLNLLLIPHFGALGSSAATFAAYMLLTGGFLTMSQRFHPIPLEKGKLAYCMAVVVAGVVLSFVFGSRAPSLEMAAIKLALLACALGGGVLTGIVDLSLLRRLYTHLRGQLRQ